MSKLHDAVTKGDADLVSRLIKWGADVNARDEDGRAPLLEASYKGNLQIIRSLLDAGADVNAREYENGRTPLHVAAYMGVPGPRAVKTLIDAGADVNARDGVGATPLHEAACFGARETVQTLIDAGADVRAQDVQGRVPLHYAVMRSKPENVLALIKAGADIDVKDNSNGFTPLHMAMRFDNPVLADILVEVGADVNARDDVGKTPLHHAAQYISQEHDRGIINTLIEWGADVNARDGNNNTPRYYAMGRGKDIIVKRLMDAEVESHNAKVLEQALKEGVKVNGSAVNLDPARYTVVRADRSQGLSLVRDFKFFDIKPAAVVSDVESNIMVFKHSPAKREQQEFMNRLADNHPGFQSGFNVSQGGSIKPLMVFEVTGALLDLAKSIEILGGGKEKSKGMEI